MIPIEAYQLELLDQIVKTVGFCINNTVLLRDEADQRCEFQVAQVVDFVEEGWVCHEASNDCQSPIARFNSTEPEWSKVSG
jgi:hypothetical protein